MMEELFIANWSQLAVCLLALFLNIPTLIKALVLEINLFRYLESIDSFLILII